LLASRCGCSSPVENDELLEDQQVMNVDDDEISRLRAFHVALWEVVGDVNANGRLDEGDVALARNLASRPEKNVPCAELADLNYDDVVDQQDVALLEQVTGSGGPTALALVPPGNNCTRRGTDIATRHAIPGDHVPILFFRKFGISHSASVRVLSGPGTLRKSDEQLYWVDVDPAALPDSRIELEISTRHEVYLLALNVLDSAGALLVAPGRSALLAEVDAGEDGGADGGTDGGIDAGIDGGVDAGQDAGTDGGTDGGMDGGTDGGTCPQRRRGCDALLVELKYEWYMRGLGDMEQRLKGIACETHVYDINTRFERKPERIFTPGPRGGPGVWNMTEAELASKLERWREWRRAEAGLLNSAIATHVAHLRAEKEIGIEVFSAHGSPRQCPDCGDLSSVELEVLIPRQSTIQTIYNGARRHVCAWVMFDTSCYSGSTVRGFGTVNNTGECRCCQPEPINRCFHAGWENDTALGSSTIEEEVINLTCAIDFSRFKDAVEAARAGGTNRVDRFINRRQFASSYIDDGYGLRCP
jgi:hypothetical protein